MSDLYFIADKEEAWIPAKRAGGEDTAKGPVHHMVTLSGSKKTLPEKEFQACETVSQNELDVIMPNLIDLESFSEGIILHQCRARYQKDLIYTFVGTILVAVNPFRALPIYTDEYINRHRSQARGSESPDPHVFAVAALALEHLASDQASQSVLISGESGAGKTETTKKILEYLASVAGKDSRRTSTVNVAQQILQSNPILESFGNAKTGRNNNSSRFGKWMELNFTPEAKIKGCRIVNYLLEKSRVVWQIPNERNYHVFYMMINDDKLKSKLKLGAASQYHYLNQSGCEVVKGRNDAEEHADMIRAMNDLEFKDETQSDIFAGLAGILNLGNISYDELSNTSGEDQVQIANKDYLLQACSHLGLDKTDVDKALCFRRMETREGVIQIPLNVKQAQDLRDAMAKEIYRLIFDFLVRRVNETIFNGPGESGLSIGVLDIFGFELFEVNSFEQLCINYANEKLQYFFNAVIFEGEMQMYRAEGIDCEQITFQDNQPCLDLIEAKGGILSKLDEELVVPNGSDAKFVQKLHSSFDKHTFYRTSLKNKQDFVVKHFAGEVTYRSDDFMEKNRDSLAEPLTEALEKSTVKLVRELFEFSKNDTGHTGSGGSPSKGSLKKPTIGKKFKSNLDTLMEALNSTAPHFIRCVKSNSKQAPKVFESPLCLRQLKYAGLFEAIRIRKSGYAYRFNHDYFVRKYYVCTSKSVDGNKAYCTAIMEDLQAKSDGGITSDDWAVGNSKVFIKTRKPRLLIEEIRNAAISHHVVVLQSFFRMGIAKIRTFAAKYEAIRKKKEALKKAREEEEARKAEEEAKKAEREAREAEEKAKREAEERERAEEVREEKEKAAKLNGAVSRIQGICRIFHAKRAAKVMRTIRRLHEAIHARECEGLQRAIKAVKREATYSRKVANLMDHAREVLNEVYEELDLKAEIEEAIEKESVEMLKMVLTKAAERKMTGAPEAVYASQLLEKILNRDDAKERLNMLTYTGNANAVLENADELEEAIRQAVALGVDQDVVSHAEKYYEKVQTLLPIRNKMRVAVELASRKMVLEGLEERREFCKVHGDDFCKEEMTAMKNMLRMFSFEVQLKGGETITPPKADSGESNIQGNDGGFDDIRLPKWCFEQLQTVQNAEDAKTRDFEIRQMERRLGSHEKMREVRRVYKWVCQYSTWRHPDHEAMIEAKYLPGGSFSLEDAEDANVLVSQNKHRILMEREEKKKQEERRIKEAGLQSGSATRDRSVRKQATFRQTGKKGGSSGYGQGQIKRGTHKKKAPVPTAEKQLNQMMKDYASFYDTHRIPLDWCP
ncbi:hypothetical protein TeGR_g7112 [Tetraparma gracilis]|uniref:Myosin motor domain-containing protein n=1 Tax=Tetraparma gracilis TaxID=2962635 RepID=A0ABQ6MP78_9STRA|nr:hypothetical protein TeGR_g7112 [Tetraparma gracilis]